MTRTADAVFLNALENASRDGLDVAKFLYVKAKTRDATPQPFDLGFWTGDYDYTVAVRDGVDGVIRSRLYYGIGTGLRLPALPRTSDMSIQTIVVGLPKNHPASIALVRENSVRMAKVDIHEGILQPHGSTLISMPKLSFLGEVDGDPIQRPAAGGNANLDLEIVSDAIRTLTRVNPARNSYETQARRSNDQFARYSNLVGNIEAPWGENQVRG